MAERPSTRPHGWAVAFNANDLPGRKRSRVVRAMAAVTIVAALVGCTAAPPASSPAATRAGQGAAPTTAPPTSPPATSGAPSATTAATAEPPTATDEPPAASGEAPSATDGPPATPPGADVTPQPVSDLPSALVFARAKVGSLPSSMAWAGGKLWLGNGFGVAELDPTTGRAVEKLDFGPVASVATMPDTDVLVSASYIEESIALVDPASGGLSSATEVPCPGALAPVSASEVWVTNPCANSVAVVALGRGVSDTVAVQDPGAIAVGGGAVWVIGDSTVVRIDRQTLEKRHVFPPALGFPSDLEYVEGPTGSAGLWVSSVIEVFVTSSLRGSLARIDPETLQPESIDPGSTALLRPLESIEHHDTDIWVVGVEPSGPFFEVPRVLVRVDTERKAVLDEHFVLPRGSIALAPGAEPDALWLGAPMDEVFGVRATVGEPVPPPPMTSDDGGMTIQTVEYASDLPDYVYLPADAASLPTFVLIGGGPVPPSEVHHMSALATALSASGAVVHVVGYRSEATGSGTEQAMEDIRCAVAYARSKAPEFGGREQVVLAGFSYGGDAVVSAVTSGGPVSPDCAVGGDGEPDAVIALDGFPNASGDMGQSVPMLFAGATGGNGLAGQRLADAMTAQGYDIESVTFSLDHRRMIDPSPTAGVVTAMVDFAAGLGE